jgi:excisionase family DNA binding protein
MEIAPARERTGWCRNVIVRRCMETTTPPVTEVAAGESERLAYSVQEAADLLGVDYFSVYRLIQRGKLRACRALRGKLLVPRTEILRLLKN